MGLAATMAVAGSVTYNINFSGGATLPTAGSFTYDTTANQFTAFIVNWDNLNFDFTSSANGSALLTGGGACISDTNAAATFSFLTSASVCGAGQSGPNWTGDGSGHGFTMAESSAGHSSTIELFNAAPGLPTDPGVSSGTFSVTQTPEPTTLLLLMAAGGGVLLARKRRRIES